MNCATALNTDHPVVDRAFRIAIGDFFGNIQPWQGELDEHPAACILAGLEYNKPWTRDGAFNSWFAGSLLTPRVSRNTLLSALTEDEWGVRIGGQYWDAIIWVTSAWNHYLCRDDGDFLSTAFEVAANSMRFFEATEFDADDGLFRGPASFQDGVAAYSDHFADSPSPGILDWVEKHPEHREKTGYGLPMKALSTNCLYYNAYQLLPEMATELEVPVEPEWSAKADRLRAAINRNFWNSERGTYSYLVDAEDDPDRQEGLGAAFAILFGVADETRAQSIFEHQHLTAHGLPCLWPTYDRYTNAEGTSFGRHSGTIWPQVNATWALAAAQNGRRDLGWFELESLAQKACRDVQFSEMYHPLTGERYGGLQENPGVYPDVHPSLPISSEPVEFNSCIRQTWCATGYIQMVLSTLFGLRLGKTGVAFSPYMPSEITRMSISGLHYRDTTLTVAVERSGSDVHVFVNDVEREEAFVPADAAGPQHVRIGLPDAGDGNSRA